MEFGLTIDSYKGVPVPVIMGLFRMMQVSRIESTIDIFQYPQWAANSSGTMGMGLHLPYMGKYGYDLGFTPGKKQIQSLIKTIRKNHPILKFDYAVFHPPEADPKDVSLDFLCENLKQLNIPLLLENSLGHSFDAFVQVAEKIDTKLGSSLAGYCIDIPHAFLAKESWPRFMNYFGNRVQLVHLSDCDGTRDNHLPFPYAGGLKLSNIMEELIDINFDGILNFEIKPPSLLQIHSLFKTLKDAKAIHKSSQ